MAKDPKPVEELSAIAKQTMEQAQGATENYLSWLQKSMSASPWANADLNTKLMRFAQQNIAAAFGFVQKLSQAKDFQDLLRIQTEFMQTQMESFGQQTRDLSEASTKAAADAMKIPVNKSS